MRLACPIRTRFGWGVHRACNADVVRIFSDKGLEQEIPVSLADQNETVSLAWPVDDRRFYRVEVWRYFPEVDQTLMAALSNPIYFRT